MWTIYTIENKIQYQSAHFHIVTVSKTCTNVNLSNINPCKLRVFPLDIYTPRDVARMNGCINMLPSQQTWRPGLKFKCDVTKCQQIPEQEAMRECFLTRHTYNSAWWQNYVGMFQNDDRNNQRTWTDLLIKTKSRF